MRQRRNHGIDDLFERKLRRIYLNGAVRLAKRRIFARGIHLVASKQRSLHSLRRLRRDAFLNFLFLTAGGPYIRRCRKVKTCWCVREHRSGDVPTFNHKIAELRQRPKRRGYAIANSLHGSDCGSVRIDNRRTDAVTGFLTLHQKAYASTFRHTLYLYVAQELRNGLRLRSVNAVLYALPSYYPVQSARINMKKPQFLPDHSRHRTLPSAAWTIYRYDSCHLLPLFHAQIISNSGSHARNGTATRSDDQGDTT